MRIVMLSWEYPPRIVGGISRHVEGISRELASRGHEVHVVTLDFPGSALYESLGSLHVHRVPVELSAPTFHSWVLLFNHFFEKKVGQIAHKYGKPDIVHVHDWLTVVSGVAGKHLLRCPLVMTFHSTEAARSGGSTSPDSNLVNGLEWWGSFEAARIITVSKWMQEHIASQFRLPMEKIDVVPNGVDTSKFEKDQNKESTRARWNIRPGEPLVTSVGRMTPQKGFDDLLRAFPRILRSVPNSRLLILGDGYMRGELESLAIHEGIADRTTFTGFLSDDGIVSALKSSDVIVLPSRFEPFGITALEAMAAGVPVVVSRVGGFAEIVDHRQDGLYVDPSNPGSIADGVIQVLSDRGLANGLAAKAKEKVKNYNWSTIAEATLRVYRQAVGESRYE